MKIKKQWMSWEEFEKIQGGTWSPSPHAHVKADIVDTPWAWADVLKTGASLADLPTRNHADLQGVSADQHHPQSHTLASHSSKTHAELTGVTSDQHHAQLHETSHRSGGGDALDHDLLAGFVAAEHVSLPNTIANVLSDHTKAVHDALGLDHANLSNVLSGQHHTKTTHDEVYGLMHQGLASGKGDAEPPAKIYYETDTGILKQVEGTSWVERLRAEASTRLAQLSEKAHGSLTGVTSDQHHPQSHTLASHSSKAHAELTGVSADQHHAQLHASAHLVGGGDALSVGTPVSIGTANSAGTATNFARRDHVHAHPSGLGASLHHTKTTHDEVYGLMHQGLASGKGAASPPAKIYYETDTGILWQVEGTSWVERLRAETVTRLAQLSEKAHSSLTGVSADQHHPQSHTLASHSTKPHSALTGVGIDDHHNKIHASNHWSGAGDPLDHDMLVNYVAAEHVSLPNTIANVLSNHTKAVHDSLALDHGALGGKGDDDHTQYYNSARHTKAIHDSLGINAGSVDGFSASQTRNSPNTCAVRDANGYLQLGWINTTSGDCGVSTPIRIYASHSGNYIRYYLPNNFATVMKPYFDNYFLLLTGGTMTGHLYAKDHGTPSVDMVVNVCYGTGSPPTASTTTIGTLFIKYS